MIKVSVYQILISALSLFIMVDRTTKYLRKETRQSLLKFIVIFAIWAAILIIALFPPILKFVMGRLGLGEGLNGLIFFGFIIIFSLIYKLLNIIERIERNITEIVRKEALKKIDKIERDAKK